MLPQPRRAAPLLLALLVLAPSALAQTPDPTDAGQGLECNPPLDACFPDLMPTNPRVDATDERFATRICTDFLNIGEGPSTGHLRVLLHVDGLPVSEKQYDKLYRRGEGEAAICWDGLMLVHGRHNYTVLVDSNNEIVESHEENNLRGGGFFVRETPRQDLVVSLDVTPRLGKPNTNQVFVMNVTNRGTNASDPTFVELVDDGGPMAKLPIPSLRPNEKYVAAHVTRPDLRPVGKFVARATVDPDGTAHEINESNNLDIAEYEVAEHPAPDLVLEDVTIQGNLTSRRGVRIDATIHNLGDRSVRGMGVRLYDLENNTLGNASTGSIIYPGLTAKVQFIVVLPAGNHTLRLMVDPLARVPERNETNNNAYVDVDIREEPLNLDAPNLVVERVFVLSDDPAPNESLQIGALVHNAGVNKSNATTLRFTIDNKTLAQVPVPVLRPGAYHTAYTTWVASAADAYVLAANVDPASTLREVAEDDNVLSTDVLVEARPPPPDPVPDAPPVNETPTKPPVVNETPTQPPVEEPDEPTGPRIVLGELILGTKPIPGGLKGVVSASLRNPNIQPVGLVTVTFRVDGELLKEVLVQGVRGAATTAATTGEIDLPPGKHVVSAEVRILGSTEPSLKREREYEVEAGDKGGVPGPGAGALVLVVAVAALARRGRR